MSRSKDANFGTKRLSSAVGGGVHSLERYEQSLESAQKNLKKQNLNKTACESFNDSLFFDFDSTGRSHSPQLDLDQSIGEDTFRQRHQSKNLLKLGPIDQTRIEKIASRN
jgi:hypothetical protein